MQNDVALMCAAFCGVFVLLSDSRGGLGFMYSLLLCVQVPDSQEPDFLRLQRFLGNVQHCHTHCRTVNTRAAMASGLYHVYITIYIYICSFGKIFFESYCIYVSRSRDVRPETFPVMGGDSGLNYHNGYGCDLTRTMYLLTDRGLHSSLDSTS